MKIASISIVFALSTLVGCAGSVADSAPDAVESDLTASRPDIVTPSSTDPNSVQAKLFTLLQTFKDDAELGVLALSPTSLILDGAGELGVRGRAISCESAQLEAVAPGGGGFTTTTSYACTLLRFESIRNGGALPSVVIPFGGNPPLAGHLVSLLEKGAAKGGLGVTRTGHEAPGCCDLQSFVSYSLSDDTSTLSCEVVSGGLAGVTEAKCSYTRNITPEQ